jgi:2-haloalkanoic acid dehalogenase type II
MMKLSDFTTLTFDCYGTLIDWETGIHTALKPLVTRAGVTLPRDALLAAFAAQEVGQQAATPAMPYAALLSAVHRQLAEAWGVAADEAEGRRFGASIGDWPAFPDTADALRYLKRHYRLVILSNVDRDGFRASNRQLGVEFDAVHTAQDIGSYKPDPRNFAYLIEQLAADGVERRQVLHVAQSLFHDHAPANAMGLASAWIDRRHDKSGWGATAAPPDGVRYDFRFDSLGALAEAHRAEQA